MVSRSWIIAASMAAIVGSAVSASAPGEQSKTDLALANGFELGRPPAGEPCSLAFRWVDRRDPGGEAGNGVDREYTINCRGPAASQVIGRVKVSLARGRVAKPWMPPTSSEKEGCGTAVRRDFLAIHDAWAQLCARGEFGDKTVRVQFERNGKIYRGDAEHSVVGPMEVALSALATRTLPDKNQKEARPHVAWDGLPRWTGGSAGEARESTAAEIFNADVLMRGARLNQQGLYVQASILLDSAMPHLSELSPDLRASLILEAALADSNSGKLVLGDRKFNQVDPSTVLGEGGLIRRKYHLYRAFAWLNRDKPELALQELTERPKTLDHSAMPLRDETRLREANDFVSHGDGTDRIIATQEVDQRTRMALDLQVARARSMAHYKLGQYREAREALGDAGQPCAAAINAQFVRLAAGGDPAAVGWLRAASLRQCARLDNHDNRQGEAQATALAAIEALTQSSIASGADLGQPVAETRVELANYYLADPNPKPELALAQFREAVDEMASATDPLSTPLPGIETYLDLLVKRFKAGEKGAAEDFFKAVQIIGTPAVARQTAEIERIVTRDPKIGSLFRDRLDREREVRRLNYAIGQLKLSAAPDSTDLAILNRDYSEARAEVAALTEQIGNVSHAGVVDNSPVTIEELRPVLDPGELYFKLTAIPGGKAYGIVISREGHINIYVCADTTSRLTKAAEILRDMASGRDGFGVGNAYALFAALTGDASDEIAKAPAIVVDGQGPLQVIPAGILISNHDSLKAYHRKREAGQGTDYSDVDFLAKRAQVSTALSPRSFVLTRRMPPALQIDKDPPLQAFLGVGAPITPSPDLVVTAAARFATPCRSGEGTVGSILNREVWHLTPIPVTGIKTAAFALGVPGADTQTGADFTDAAFMARKDLSRYMVIHFATHGLPEQRIACADIPPALVTSVDPTEPKSDGLLSYDEVAQLRLNANLVVLAACETHDGISERAAAASGQESGTTLEGLPRAFLAAQARAVIATYWRVPVGAMTDDLMDVLYINGRTGTIGAALRAAQRHLIASKQFSHPFYWGSYFLVGDSRRRMLESQPAPRAAVGG